MSSPSLGRKGQIRGEEEAESRVGASRTSVLDSDPGKTPSQAFS